MFGRRFDGWSLRSKDPFMKMIPLIMKKRNDAQVFLNLEVDCKYADEYIKRKRLEGIKVSHMAIVLAAFVRTVSQRPEINRFIVGNKVFVRNQLTISFAILKHRSTESVEETTVKLHFDPTDTLYEVADKIEKIIEKEKNANSVSQVDKLAATIFRIPLIPPILVGFLKIIDRVGILPKPIINVSPFHTSMFITNMASIRMNKVYHHIYNFGTTSVFTSIGKREKKLVISKDGKLNTKWVMPLGFVIDERIAAGATYAVALHLWEKYMRNPELLEIVPDKVRYDDGRIYQCKKKHLRKKFQENLTDDLEENLQEA
ncbi:2-oxo acid dehydrogenase subunit E2 [Sedimentibacter sp. zth1]|uniref:2-oxo acid dehydrogenase subunit E2 n=1 Tax=Sedimentibacter sp. zth1 TaxID=2816908 RepID=UPI001A92A26F|nr:2-oxo acid dehydrogenase subunit E2 [Sedimentibacter sp. zth1]QSX06754.1 2-oxo acid dehydrogenase subunit E2 [Sedimentibacter sp. zth1]